MILVLSESIRRHRRLFRCRLCRPRDALRLGRGGLLLLLFGLIIGWSIGDRAFGRIESIVGLILTGTLMLFMVEMGMVTAG